MVKDHCFVFVGLQPWDIAIGSTAKNIAMEVAKHNRVLFVNPPLGRSEWLLHRSDARVQRRLEVIREKRDSISQEGDSLWVLTPRKVVESVNFVEPHGLYRWLNRINDQRLASEIGYACHRLGFVRYILFNDNSMLSGFNLKELLRPMLYLYLLRDNVIAVSYHRRHGTRMQPELVAKADLVFANSGYFADYCRQHNPNTHMIGQGCDVSLYSDSDGLLPVAPELSAIPRPIVGYTGSLTTRRLDINLLLDLAIYRPEWSIVLVGPQDEQFASSHLHDLANIHFIPTQPVERLPSFIKWFDVAINPQAVNIITSWNYPLKIDEYLALGKPVVATHTPFMEYFDGWVRLGKNAKEYVHHIEQALAEDTPELYRQRIAYAATHTWELFVEKIYERVEEALALQQPSNAYPTQP
jgi:teichuronic acid biosynthesis glycosyltransferase TuaH